MCQRYTGVNIVIMCVRGIQGLPPRKIKVHPTLKERSRRALHALFAGMLQACFKHVHAHLCVQKWALYVLSTSHCQALWTASHEPYNQSSSDVEGTFTTCRACFVCRHALSMYTCSFVCTKMGTYVLSTSHCQALWTASYEPYKILKSAFCEPNPSSIC